MAGSRPASVGKNFVFRWDGNGGHDKINLGSQAVVNLQPVKLCRLIRRVEVVGASLRSRGSNGGIMVRMAISFRGHPYFRKFENLYIINLYMFIMPYGMLLLE